MLKSCRRQILFEAFIKYVLIYINATNFNFLLASFTANLNINDSLTIPTCPNQCICTPSSSRPTVLKSIVCSCKPDENSVLIPTITTTPLGGDYPDNNDDYSSADRWVEKWQMIKENNQHLYFNSSTFDLWSSVERIVIHSCKQVTLEKNAFYHIEIVDQLKLVDIQSIEIQSSAFLGIKRAPKQIVIQDSGVHTISNHAFTGLSHIEHFWWRNVTINKISKLAFTKLSNIGYFYFRDVSVQTIESGAFAHLRNIHHFFIRQKIKIASVGDHIFLGSKIDELVFESVEMNTTDLTFVGMIAKRVHFLNCKWFIHRHSLAPRHGVPLQKVDEFHVYNSTLNRFSPVYYYNFSTILFEKTQIETLHTPTTLLTLNRTKTMPIFVAFNIGNIHFRYCHLTQWQSHALSGAFAIGTIRFTKSKIYSIQRSAIHASQIDQLRISQTRIKSIATHAFTLNKFDVISCENVEIDTLGGSIFHKTSIINSLTMQNTSICHVDERAFASITECGRAEFEHCVFGKFPIYGFENSKVNSLWIHSSKFLSFFAATIFNRLDALSLSVIQSEFRCRPTACEDNALLLHQTIHNNIAWIFAKNRCVKSFNVSSISSESLLRTFYNNDYKQDNEDISFLFFSDVDQKSKIMEKNLPLILVNGFKVENDDENVCAEEVETVNDSISYGLICRRRIFIEECVCTKSLHNIERTDTNYIHLPNTTAKILLVGDCPRFFIERSLTTQSMHKIREHYSNEILTRKLKPSNSGRPNLKFVYLYRIDSLRISSKLDISIQQLHILYSNIQFAANHLKISKTNTIKNGLTLFEINESFNNGANLDQIQVIGSIVKSIGPYAFTDYQRIGTIVFNRTTVHKIDSNAFAQSRVDRVELWHSDIINAGDMLVHVDEMRVEQSQLPLNASSYLAPSKTVLTSYELCMLLGGKNVTPTQCKKCLKRGCTASLTNKIMTNNTAIIKRCTKQNIATKDCEFLLADPLPVLADIQVSVISQAVSLYIVPRLIFINCLINFFSL